jgi:hypothetical protein
MQVRAYRIRSKVGEQASPIATGSLDGGKLEPVTCNPQPATRDPQPATRNPQPATCNPQPATCNQPRWGRSRRYPLHTEESSPRSGRVMTSGVIPGSRKRLPSDRQEHFSELPGKVRRLNSAADRKTTAVSPSAQANPVPGESACTVLPRSATPTVPPT